MVIRDMTGNEFLVNKQIIEDIDIVRKQLKKEPKLIPDKLYQVISRSDLVKNPKVIDRFQFMKIIYAFSSEIFIYNSYIWTTEILAFK